MLYTINKSPSSTHNLTSLLRIAPAGSPILLYEDGVYGAMPSPQTIPIIQAAMDNHKIYALDADLEARGIDRVIDGIHIIGYDEFVELVEKHDVTPWL